jgi:hypothetical protein
VCVFYVGNLTHLQWVCAAAVGAVRLDTADVVDSPGAAKHHLPLGCVQRRAPATVLRA